MFHLRGLATYRGGVIVSLALVIFVLTTSVGRCETTACPKEGDGWSDAEKEVYKTFCADRSYGRLGLRLTETRYDVSAKFIVELLTNDAYRKSGSRGFRLSSIRSVEPIDLRHLKTAESIAFVNSELLGGVNLSSAVIDGDLSFLDSKLGPVVLTHAIVKGSVLLGQAPDQDPSPEKNRGGLIVFGVDAEGAQIESDIRRN